MYAKHITPILNVSDVARSFAWFESLGWRKCWDWGTPPTFGSVGSGECEIFMCLDGQGHRHDPALPPSFTTAVWMSIWVDDVDGIYAHCVAQGLNVIRPPKNEPWGIREMHLRHPDGHVFRLSQTIAGEP
jgi:predicted enzyme related to lactoylglutathione lyase